MAPPSYSCSTCSGKFPLYVFTNFQNSPVCRWCDTSKELRQALTRERAEKEELRNRLEILAHKVEELEENNRFHLSGSKTYASVSRQKTSSTSTNKNISSSYRSTELRSNVSTKPGPPMTNSDSSLRSDQFVPVRNGARPRQMKTCLPVITTNKFSILGFEDDTEKEVRIVGDSLVREQLEEFCGRNPVSRKRFCYPGARVEDITNDIDYISANGTDDTKYFVHVGTNNVLNTRSEELLQKYKDLLQRLKEKTNNNNIIISGILPRIMWRTDFFGKASYINNSLKSLCLQEGVHFVNFWNHFYDKKMLFAPDGLHLSSVGNSRFGRLINSFVSSLQAKNGRAIVRAGST